MDATYALEQCLGTTPAFSLHHARRLGDGVPVLVKARGSDAIDRGRADAEFGLLCRLGGDGIAPAQALVESTHGPLIEFPDLPGELLETLLEPAQQFDVASFLPLATQMVHALDRVHGAHLVAGDLRPAHWLVDRARGRSWLIDLSHALPDTAPASAFVPTDDADWAGVSPERTGRLGHRVDARSDFYALGVVFYRMLGGRPPFQADDPLEWAHCHMARQPVPLQDLAPGIAPTLAAVVMKLLVKQPQDRYLSAQGLLTDLARHAKDEPMDAFVPGSKDAPTGLHLPQRSYGREREALALQAALERVASSAQPALATVIGAPGMGKSRLAQELRPAVVARHGLWVHERFEPQHRHTPGAGLAGALRTLVRHLLTQSDERVVAWRRRLGKAVGGDARLLVDLAPELDFVFGSPSPLSDMPPTETRHRLALAVGRFVRAFARRSHPLVLVFDDVHDADESSLWLLGALLARAEPADACALLLVLTWRDDASPGASATQALVATLHRDAASVTEVRLQALPLPPLARLLADALGASEADVQPLARLLHRRSGGNPLFFTQLLESLQGTELLQWDARTRAWSWDLAKAQALNFADGMADVVVQRLQRLPLPTQRLLQVAACIGQRFDLERLARLSGLAAPSLHQQLAPAVRENLLLLGRDGARFGHERIRQSAYDSMAPLQRAECHLRLARTLADGLSSDAADEYVFELSHHFRQAAALLQEPKEKLRAAALHARAGRLARAAAAQASAAEWFAAGGDLLGDEAWALDPELAFTLRIEQAECEFAAGHPERAAELIEALKPHATTTLRLAALCRLEVELHVLRSAHEQAIVGALDCLRRFGIDLAQHPDEAALQAELDTLWQRLGARPIESLATLPRSDDVALQQALRLLSVVLGPAYFTDLQAYCLYLARMVNLSLEHGRSDASAHAFAFFGVVLGPVLHRFQDGERFAHLALDLAERGEAGGARAAIHYAVAMVASWTRPLAQAEDAMRSATRIAEDTGNLAFACYGRLQTSGLLLARQAPLAAVQCDAEQGLLHATQAHFDDVAGMLRIQLDFVQALQGPAPKAPWPEAAAPDDVGRGAGGGTPRTAALSCARGILDLQAALIAGNPKRALAGADAVRPLLWAGAAQVQLREYHLGSALALAALHGTGDAPPRETTRARLHEHLTVLSEWSAMNPATFGAAHRLAAAEAARIDGREAEATLGYERALSDARAQALVGTEALACECAAAFHRACGHPVIADAYLRDACRLYARWGADAKVRQLEERHPQLRPRALPAAREAGLDLLALFKATQAISGRIVLDELVDVLMRTMLEHAGAQYGALWLVQGAAGVDPVPAAQAEVQGQVVQVRPRDAGTGLRACPVPTTLLNYVQRSRERVLVADTTKSHAFAADLAASPVSPRSLVCLPIVRQSTLIGVLYLEHRSLPDVFTAERMDVLELLAAQAAISLENAILYANLQREYLDRQRADAALREGQARIRRLVDSNIIGIFFWDMAGHITEANAAFLQLVGYSRDELLAGQVEWTAMTPPEWRAADQLAGQELSRTGICTSYEKEYIRRDGRRVPVLLGAALLEDSRDTGVAFVLDLSERRRAEAEQRARAAAEAANEAKSSFLANMSHEIRTPMNAILGMSWLALQSGLNPQQHNYVQKVHRSAEALLGIINDILDFSKVEAGRLDMEQIPFQLGDVFDHLANVLGLRADEKRLELVFDVAPGLPPLLRGDPSRLGQVLLNLGGNAVKFSERGAVVVAVRETSRDASSVRLRFEVRDSGIGISTEQRQRLFQPFAQADASTSRRYGGTGLGLAISRRLVELMGGELDVDSEPGRGSCFHFEARFGLEASERATAPAAHVLAPLRGARVLVVDDNDVARELLLRLCGSIGLAPDAAADGEAALRAVTEADARDQPFRLVLLDWRMPVLDGVGCAQRLAGLALRHPLPTVLMLTAFTRDEVQRQLAALGVSVAATLVKPVTPSTLLDACLAALQAPGRLPSRGAQREEALAAQGARLAGTRVLLVEDNPINQELARDILSRAGVVVLVADNGQEAIDRLQREPVDAVLMDCQMPVMDGYAAARELRRHDRWRELPVIAMTANAMAGDREAVLAAGMNDHVAKPIKVEDLFATLARWIRHPLAASPPLDTLDRPAALASLNGDERLYRRLLDMFAQRETRFAERFRAARAAGDLDGSMRMAHDLRSVSATLGARTVAEAAGLLEQACLRGAPTGELEPLLSDVAQRLEPLLEGLQRPAAGPN